MTEHLIVTGTDRIRRQVIARWQCSCGVSGSTPDRDTVERQAEQHVPAGAPVRWKVTR